MYALSRMYRSGLGVPLDERIATEWLRKIADASRSAKSELVSVGGYNWTRKGELSENTDVISTAFHKLGWAFHRGRGVSTDDVEAYKWYNLAASRGYISGEQDRDLLASQMTAEKIVQGQERASAWLNPKNSLPEANISRQGSAAAPKSLPPSGTNRATAISLDDVAPKQTEATASKPTPEEEAELNEVVGARYYADRQYASALEPLRRAAMMGRAKAQSYLGSMYSSGLGVQQSYSEGVKWYAKAVRRGYLPDFHILANRYMYGNGVEKNLSEAVRLSRIAAEAGNVDAQFQLGQCYQYGEGVKDELEAEKWYRRAAEQGESSSLSQLASMYSNRALVLTQRLTKEAESTWSPDQIEPKYRSDPVWGPRFRDLSKTNWERTLLSQREPQFKELRIEKYKWAILGAKQGQEYCQGIYEMITNTTPTWFYEMHKAEYAEAFHRVAAFVPRKENTNEWLTGDAPRSGAGEASSSGTGFFISEDGYLLTNFHVVDDAMSIVIKCGGNTYPARLVKADPINDLALLKLAGKFKAIPLGPSRTAKMGDSVFTVGFPNPQLQGVAPKLTDGKISSLSGMQDDSRHFQISVAVQPGNSGGALVNSVGNIVGIVTARLSDKAALESSGALPQNVNYAVKSSFILAFLESVPELVGKLKEPWPVKERKFEDVVKDALEAAALVLVY
jgi:TPR repeat protein/S1-C subfamily serine protease